MHRQSHALLISVALVATVLFAPVDTTSADRPAEPADEFQRMANEYLQTNGFAGKSNEWIARFLTLCARHDQSFDQKTYETMLGNLAAQRIASSAQQGMPEPEAIEQVVMELAEINRIVLQNGGKASEVVAASVRDLAPDRDGIGWRYRRTIPYVRDLINRGVPLARARGLAQWIVEFDAMEYEKELLRRGYSPAEARIQRQRMVAAGAPIIRRLRGVPEQVRPHGNVAARNARYAAAQDVFSQVVGDLVAEFGLSSEFAVQFALRAMGEARLAMDHSGRNELSPEKRKDIVSNAVADGALEADEFRNSVEAGERTGQTYATVRRRGPGGLITGFSYWALNVDDAGSSDDDLEWSDIELERKLLLERMNRGQIAFTAPHSLLPPGARPPWLPTDGTAGQPGEIVATAPLDGPPPAPPVGITGADQDARDRVARDVFSEVHIRLLNYGLPNDAAEEIAIGAMQEAQEATEEAGSNGLSSEQRGEIVDAAIVDGYAKANELGLSPDNSRIPSAGPAENADEAVRQGLAFRYGGRTYTLLNEGTPNINKPPACQEPTGTTAVNPNTADTNALYDYDDDTLRPDTSSGRHDIEMIIVDQLIKCGLSTDKAFKYSYRIRKQVTADLLHNQHFRTISREDIEEHCRVVTTMWFRNNKRTMDYGEHNLTPAFGLIGEDISVYGWAETSGSTMLGIAIFDHLTSRGMSHDEASEQAGQAEYQATADLRRRQMLESTMKTHRISPDQILEHYKSWTSLWLAVLESRNNRNVVWVGGNPPANQVPGSSTGGPGQIEWTPPDHMYSPEPDEPAGCLPSGTGVSSDLAGIIEGWLGDQPDVNWFDPNDPHVQLLDEIGRSTALQSTSWASDALAHVGPSPVYRKNDLRGGGGFTSDQLDREPSYYGYRMADLRDVVELDAHRDEPAGCLPSGTSVSSDLAGFIERWWGGPLDPLAPYVNLYDEVWGESGITSENPLSSDPVLVLDIPPSGAEPADTPTLDDEFIDVDVMIDAKNLDVSQYLGRFTTRVVADVARNADRIVSPGVTPTTLDAQGTPGTNTIASGDSNSFGEFSGLPNRTRPLITSAGTVFYGRGGIGTNPTGTFLYGYTGVGGIVFSEPTVQIGNTIYTIPPGANVRGTFPMDPNVPVGTQTVSGAVDFNAHLGGRLQGVGSLNVAGYGSPLTGEISVASP